MDLYRMLLDIQCTFYNVYLQNISTGQSCIFLGYRFIENLYQYYNVYFLNRFPAYFYQYYNVYFQNRFPAPHSTFIYCLFLEQIHRCQHQQFCVYFWKRFIVHVSVYHVYLQNKITKPILHSLLNKMPPPPTKKPQLSHANIKFVSFFFTFPILL